MTREDMLDCLHYELENLRVARGSDYSGVEAIEMAIKMLEVQEQKGELMGEVFGQHMIPLGKYEYHYDHTDCIWYRPEARNRCPVTCAQYRDGWNDAMQYIFRDGKGYRPYRRDKTYE